MLSAVLYTFPAHRSIALPAQTGAEEARAGDEEGEVRAQPQRHAKGRDVRTSAAKSRSRPSAGYAGRDARCRHGADRPVLEALKQVHLHRLWMGIQQDGFGTIRFLQRGCVGTAVMLRSDLLYTVRTRRRGQWAQARSAVTLISDSLPDLLGSGYLTCCTRFGRAAGAIGIGMKLCNHASS
jgi:hypothetical protein